MCRCPPTDGGRFMNFYHNCTNSILQHLETKLCKITDVFQCSEFHQWLIHLNNKNGIFYWPYSLVPDPQFSWNCESSTILGRYKRLKGKTGGSESLSYTGRVSSMFKFFYYEQQIKWEVQGIHICGCRWNERLEGKTHGSTRLGYTGFRGQLEHLMVILSTF